MTELDDLLRSLEASDSDIDSSPVAPVQAPISDSEEQGTSGSINIDSGEEVISPIQHPEPQTVGYDELTMERLEEAMEEIRQAHQRSMHELLMYGSTTTAAWRDEIFNIDDDLADLELQKYKEIEEKSINDIRVLNEKYVILNSDLNIQETLSLGTLDKKLQDGEEFLDTLFDRGKCIVKEDLLESFRDKVAELKKELPIYKVITDRYGKDHVDISGRTVIIHYPELTIRNSINNSHDIKDLYVKFTLNTSITIPKLIKTKEDFEELPINYSNSSISGIRGTRTSLTEQEARANYFHSHLPRSGSPGSFDDFCLGSGTGTISHTLCWLNEEFDEERLDVFLTNLDEYVRWESLEGGPYIKMSDIGNSVRGASTLRRSYNYPDGLFESFFALGLINEDETALSYASGLPHVKLLQPQELASKIRGQHTHGLLHTNLDLLICTLSVDGIYNSINNNSSSRPLSGNFRDGRDLFTFNGTLITFNLITNAEKTQQPTEILHPDCREFIESKLTAEFKKILYNRGQEKLSSDTGNS